jgi:hypothetical protein
MNLVGGVRMGRWSISGIGARIDSKEEPMVGSV